MFWRVCRIFFALAFLIAKQKETIRPMLVYNQAGKITNREFLINRGMVSTKRKRADRRCPKGTEQRHASVPFRAYP